MTNSDKKYTKVEREIMEILDEIEDTPDDNRPDNIVEFKRRDQPRFFSKPHVQFPSWSQALTPGKLLLAAVIFALLALFLRSTSMTLAGILAILSVGCFLGLLFVRSSSTPTMAGGTRTKRWRGRDIEFGAPKQHHLENRFSRWLNKFRR